MQNVDVVVGGQYGSEAKGHVTAQLVKQAVLLMKHNQVEGPVINVRVAGPNAGHTAYDAEGNKFAFRSLPVGAVIDPEVILYIAPGSEVDLPVLLAEIELAEAHGHSTIGRLFMSRQATLIEPRHKEFEGQLVGKIGSTGKGIGAARSERLMRNAATMGQAYGDYIPTIWEWAEPEDLYATDDLVHYGNQHVIIEGTQGYGLGLRSSGNYPYVTSSDCRSIDFLAMAGIDPTRHSVHVTNWVVARVFPIRVAGNSGPMKGETSWDELGLDQEFTTVTQKVRRVGEWDPELLRAAIQANGGHNAKVVVTMLDQVIPELKRLHGITVGVEEDGDMSPYEAELTLATDWLNENASYEVLGARIGGFCFSPVDMLFTDYEQPGSLLGNLDEVLGELFGLGADDEQAREDELGEGYGR